MTDPTAAPPAAAPKAAAPKPEPAPAPAAEVKTTWLTTRPSERFGPGGAFVDLTKAESDAAPKGLLAKPTADQLALRVES